MILGMPAKAPKTVLKRKKAQKTDNTAYASNSQNTLKTTNKETTAPRTPRFNSAQGTNSVATTWPPSGWPMFRDISATQGMSTRQCDLTKVVHGASFHIDSKTIDKTETLFSIEIQEWSYDQSGQHRIFAPILVTFKNYPHKNFDQEKDAPIFQSVRIFNRDKTPKSQSETNRCALVVAYMVSRIEKGIVPDVKRILKLYNLL